jgi:UTP-glucose-1-phosphate uridylyltransferase
MLGGGVVTARNVARSDVAHVVVAAGGLGTRVAGWSSWLPKEFQPVNGRPGIAHLLDEIAALGPARVAVVYHPYYRPFIRWVRDLVTRGGLARYQALSSGPAPTAQGPQGRLEVVFVRQRGRYADITSVLNGTDRLRPPGDVFVAFADNLYSPARPLVELAAAPAGVATVLARPFELAAASERGVIVCGGQGTRRTLRMLIEKPAPAHAAALADRYGSDNLRLLEGRARLPRAVLAYLANTVRATTGAEPKLSLALGRYSRDHRVEIITTTAPVIDLGAGEAIRRPSERRSGTTIPVG